MLTIDLSCYELNNTSLIHEEKRSPKHCQIFNAIKVLGYKKISVHYIQKEKKENFQIFLHLLSGKSAYQTASVFTQHYYVCPV